ncbi:MAG: hypothetical protein KF809_17210 [Chloroflexi bacterium]|nr:hypothetical protein [Chloroflexota bacterium]
MSGVSEREADIRASWEDDDDRDTFPIGDDIRFLIKALDAERDRVRVLAAASDHVADVLTRTSIALHRWHAPEPQRHATAGEMADAASRCSQPSCREARKALAIHMAAIKGALTDAA